jgi:hypothetical protein
MSFRPNPLAHTVAEKYNEFTEFGLPPYMRSLLY